MKNRLFSIFTALLIAFIFTPNLLGQDALQKGSNEPLDNEKTPKVRKLIYSTNDISFSHDGKRLALAGNYGILIYDIQRNRKSVQVSEKPIKLREHPGRGWRVAFSPDGKLIASMAASGFLYLWDAKTEKLLRTIKAVGQCMAFSPDGRIIATGGYRVITKDGPAKDGPARKGIVNNISITMDSGIRDGIVSLWDTQTGEHIRTLTGHAASVNSVAFSPDGIIIAAGDSLTLTVDGQGRNPTVRLWDARTGKLLRALKGHRYHIRSVAFSPDGKLIASGGDHSPIRLWDVNTGQQIRTFGRGAPTTRDNRDNIEVGSARGTQGSRRFGVPRALYLHDGRPFSVDSIAFSPDGSTLVSSWTCKVLLWDVNRGRVLRKFKEQNSGGGPTVAVFSPDGRTIAVCSTYEVEQIIPKSNGVTIYKEIELWDAETGKHLHRIKLEKYRFETYR